MDIEEIKKHLQRDGTQAEPDWTPPLGAVAGWTRIDEENYVTTSPAIADALLWIIEQLEQPTEVMTQDEWEQQEKDRQRQGGS